jgi:altronate hydrolase
VPPNTLRLHPADDVCVALRPLAAGDRLDAAHPPLRAADAVPAGHKIALRAVKTGERILKFGETIGFAACDIAPGSWVHTKNLSAAGFERDPAIATDVPPDPAPVTDRTFAGYRRPGRPAGTRNYLAVVSSVNCSASVSKAVAARFPREALGRDFPNVDGILALTHKGGCGMQFAGDDHRQLARVLAGYAQHPNVGAALLIGLGCETASLGFLRDQLRPGSDVPALVMQDLGGTASTIEIAVRRAAELLPRLNDMRRSPVPASELTLGTNCGGSDGHSGITANPALGHASDCLVACGGASVLAETTEIYGAEHLLTRRARTREVGLELLERIRWWERYVAMFGVQLDNNPSPGNKAGGLTTIYEKSLGAVAKGGTTALNSVVRYAEPVRSRGLVFMDTPGLDPVSVTGLVAGGCQLIAFTTGRGSCFGSKPAPTIKIATNTPLFQRMGEDMDFDAGLILSGLPVADAGRQLFEFILEVAGGRKTRSELLGLGDEEFAPWSIGPTL